MATIQTAQFTVGWTTCYPSLLTDDTGRMTTRGRYADVFAAPGGELVLPWASVTEPSSWNRFWSSYLSKPGAMRQLSADAAWEHLVPLRAWNQPDLLGPAGATAWA